MMTISRNYKNAYGTIESELFKGIPGMYMECKREETLEALEKEKVKTFLKLTKRGDTVYDPESDTWSYTIEENLYEYEADYVLEYEDLKERISKLKADIERYFADNPKARYIAQIKESLGGYHRTVTIAARNHLYNEVLNGNGPKAVNAAAMLVGIVNSTSLAMDEEWVTRTEDKFFRDYYQTTLERK